MNKRFSRKYSLLWFREMCRIVNLFISVLAVMFQAGWLLADQVPVPARGVYGGVSLNGACVADQPTVLLNGTMVVFIDPSAGDPTITIGEADWQDGAIFLVRGEDYAVLPPLESLDRCNHPPAIVTAAMGEAIAIFSSMDEIQDRCTNDSAGKCVETLVATLDVSGDKKLSAAEISRTIRAVSVYFSYETAVARQRSELIQNGWPVGFSQAAVPVSTLYGATAAFSVAAPFATTSLLSSYDYSGDGFIEAAEILQDREDLDLDALTLAVVARLGEDGVRGMISGLPGLLKGFGESLMPMIMGAR